MEHRWGQRRELILRVRLCRRGRASIDGWLTNVSLSGAYVKTRAGSLDMSLIQIEEGGLSSREGREPLRLHARVVRREPGGVGIEWESLEAAELAEILRIAALSEASGRGRQVPPSAGAVIAPTFEVTAPLTESP